MSAVIGSRWKPGHIVRRDTETGHFEEINSPVITRSEMEVQRALLTPLDRPSDVVEWFESSEYNEANYADEYQRSAIAEHNSMRNPEDRS